MDKPSTVGAKPKLTEKRAQEVRETSHSRIIADILRRVKQKGPKAWRDFSAHSKR